MTLPETLARRGIRFRLAGLKLHMNCIFCESRGKPTDTKMRLCIHLGDGWGKCLHCGWKHRYAALPVLKQLGIQTAIEGMRLAPVSETSARVTLPDDFQCLATVEDGDDLEEAACQYVLSRGISRKQIRENNIGVSLTGRFAYRIIFPIYDNKTLVGMNARIFAGTRTPKYLLSKGEKYLYNFRPEAETTVFSEGVIKSLRIARVTKYGSAALLGHNLTDKQLEQIINSACKHVILYSDPDFVGRQGVVHIADKLIEHWKGRVSLVSPVPGPADEVPFRKLRSVLANNVVPYDVEASGIRRKFLLDSGTKN